MSKSQPGNQHGIKIKDEDARQDAYRSYCDYVASGKPKQAWSYRKGEHTCCWKTMERYMRENPSEFPTFLMQEAESKRYRLWFEKGEKLMEGKYKFGSPVIWQTIMRNMFKDVGWDNDKHAADINPELTRQFSSLMDLLSQRQNKV